MHLYEEVDAIYITFMMIISDTKVNTFQVKRLTDTVKCLMCKINVKKRTHYLILNVLKVFGPSLPIRVNKAGAELVS